MLKTNTQEIKTHRDLAGGLFFLYHCLSERSGERVSLLLRVVCLYSCGLLALFWARENVFFERTSPIVGSSPASIDAAGTRNIATLYAKLPVLFMEQLI